MTSSDPGPDHPPLPARGGRRPRDPASSGTTSRARSGRYTADSTGPRTVPRALPYDRARRGELAARAAAGEIVRVRRGVYMPALPDGAREREASILAAVRGAVDAFTTQFWVSHDTAALLWGCWTWHLSPVAHITQLGNPHLRGEDAAVRRHWTDLPWRDRARLDDVPVTGLERTVVDCARAFSLERSMVVVDSALRLGARPSVIGQILDESRGRRGVVRARRAVELADPRSESPGETLVRLAAIQGGLPRPDAQIEVATASGTFVVDLGWQELRLGVEFDGAVKYSGGEYGEPDDARRAERAREAALVDAGWTIVRVTWDELADPVALGARLMAAWTAAHRRRAHGRATPR